MNRSGPDANPIRRWPRATRCETAELHRGVLVGRDERRLDARAASRSRTPPAAGGPPATGSGAWSAPVSACRPETKMMPETPRSSSISTYSSSVAPDGDCVHSTGVKPRCDSADSITWANAGKIGLISSGITSPIRPADRAPQPGRPLEAEHVERGQDRLFGLLRHPRLAVQHPGDRRLADPRLGRDVRQPRSTAHAGHCTHRRLTLQQDPARTCRLQTAHSCPLREQNGHVTRRTPCQDERGG